MLTKATIDELVNLRSEAKLAAETFSEAVAAQAEKHGVNKGALKKYVSALEADKVGKLDEETAAILELIEKTDQQGF
jgi:hypothetical protein